MTWEKRLLRARKHGSFARIDKEKAGAWPTCAVGERFKIQGLSLPHYVSEQVACLGHDFMNAVKADDVYVAVHLYDQIQHAKKR